MSKMEKWKVILSIICISFIQGLQFSVSPVLEQISEHYREVDVSTIQMLITAPSLISIVVAFTCGWLVTKISKKKLLLFAGLIAGVSGIVPLWFDSFQILFAGRLLYGISLGLSTTLNTAVVADFFEGDERVSVMGIQGASIGAGMIFITTAAGLFGKSGFQNSYKINLIGFVALALIAVCLPDKRNEKTASTEKITLNKEVYIISAFALLEFLFLITFTTNIAMHISGPLKGDTAVSGLLTGVFSGIQIIAGICLGKITKITKRYTMSAAMLSFGVGAVFLSMFPSDMKMLMLGAVFCGFSQGVFIPTGMVAVSNAVAPVATAMASAVFTGAMSLGQFISPTALNTCSKVIFGEVTTTNVYLISAVGMTVSAVLAFIWKSKRTI